MKAWIPAAAVLVLAACERPLPPPPPPPPPQPPPAVEVSEPEEALRPARGPLRLVDDGDLASLRQALGRSRRWLARQADDREFVFGPRRLTAAELEAAYARFDARLAEEPAPEELAAWVAEEFELLASVGTTGDGRVLVTGYYEPTIEGSRRRTAEYRVPIYGRPRDMITADLGLFAESLAGRRIAGRLRGSRLVPYPARRELREKAELAGLEIGWARDRVDLFFVEIQGSGTVLLPDGGEMRIGYAGSNGREYRSVGKLLIDEGRVPRERMSMQAIREYLAQNPDDVDRVLDYNESVVFFRRLDGPPVGSLGFPVTPGRSIALDHRLMPRGALAFLATERPARDAAGEVVSEGTLRRFVLSQDTGGAIRGPGRVDFFWGRGPEAAERAGVMQHPGRLYFLIPKGAGVAHRPPPAPHSAS